MTFQNYIQQASTRETPQSEPIPGCSDQVENNTGGFVFQLDDWGRLDRFLVLGTEGGTYYVTESRHTKQSMDAVWRCIQTDGVRVVRQVVEISNLGRAPKNDPAILVLAACLKKGDEATKNAAEQAVPKVCRIGTHLFHLVAAIEGFGGWGRRTKRAVANWYRSKEPRQLAYQLVKYQSRDSWAHRDVLRLTKPSGHQRGSDFDRLLQWSVGKGIAGEHASEADPLRLVWAFEEAKRADSVQKIVGLIQAHNLPRECIPTQFLTEAAVWDALLHAGSGMPMTALLRNLGKISQVGLLDPLSKNERFVVERLTDAMLLCKARVHPLAVLVAMVTYQSGHGARGSLSWNPSRAVVDALDSAFYSSFRNVRFTGKRICLALDVSGSMCYGTIAGLPGITPKIASAALALITARVEPSWYCLAFTSYRHAEHRYNSGLYNSGLSTLSISPRQRLDDVVQTITNVPWGPTDCALPMLHAVEQKLSVDAFVVYTDSETRHGTIHPCQALARYREQTGIPAKLIVVGMASTGFTIADPADTGCLDVVGMDTATPNLISDFIQ